MGIGAAVLGAAGIGAVGSIASGLIGSKAAKSAADTQAQAALQGELLQAQELNTIQGYLAPYRALGEQGASMLGGQLGRITQPFAPTMDQLAATPGYQFALKQGQLATQNALSGTQPGGAAAKSLINYSEGLASTTFQQQFQNYLAQNQQVYNMLAGTTQIGANAAAGAGQFGMQGTSNITNLLTGGAAAQAAGTIGGASSWLGALSGGTNALSNAIGIGAMTGMFKGGGGSSASSSSDLVDQANWDNVFSG